MIARSRFGFAVVAASTVIAAAACSDKQPGEPSGQTASVTAPQPQLPANNGQIAFASQPVTLAVRNAVVTQGSGTVYTFEVATDASFANKVQTKDGVTEGSAGRTTVTIDALAGARDYYWRARATGGGTIGLFSSTFKFTVGPAITIGAPVPIAPLTGAQTSRRPTLRVANASRTGPAGTISYRFEIATDPGFTSILVSGTTTEGVNETSFGPDRDLTPGATVYWRAFALDASNGVTSAPSLVQSFLVLQFTQAERVAAQIGTTLWPGRQPPGTFGHATMGEGWNLQTLHHIPTNTVFQSPTIEDARIFDLLDRGYDPESAINWMNSNGYYTVAFWYPPPEKAVIGLPLIYIASVDKIVVNGTWNIVLKLE